MRRRRRRPVAAQGDPALRRPRRVYAVGDDPDPRFTLANERTLLAWIRTALALIVAGVAIVAVGDFIAHRWFADVVAVISFGSGVVLAATALYHWAQVERALRENRPLPSTIAIPIVFGTVVGLAVLGIIALVIDR